MDEAQPSTKLGTHTDPQTWGTTHYPFGLNLSRSLSTKHTLYRIPTFSTVAEFPPAPFLIFNKKTRSGAIVFSPSQASMVGPTRKPPRPPNAWILYRSAKLAEYPVPNDPSTPRLPQAEISKIISKKWREEPLEVRKFYENLADCKKLDHQKRNPGYRYQPMKREEKERLRQEKKDQKMREKEAKTARTRRETAAGVEPGSAAALSPEIMYGPHGPSPPLSAAPSPEPVSPLNSPRASNVPIKAELPPIPASRRIASPDAFVCPYPTPEVSPTAPQTPPASARLLFPAYDDVSPLSENFPRPLPPPLYTQPSQPLPSVSGWSEADAAAEAKLRAESSGASEGAQQLLSPNDSDNGYFHFTLPPDWNPQDPIYMDESARAMLSGTFDPNVYHLQSLDSHSLLDAPLSGEIEVTMCDSFTPYSNGYTGSNGEDYDISMQDDLLDGFNSEQFISAWGNIANSSGSSVPLNQVDTSTLLCESVDRLFELQAEAAGRSAVMNHQPTTTSLTHHVLSQLNLDMTVRPSFSLPSPPATSSALSTTGDSPPYETPPALVIERSSISDFVYDFESQMPTPPESMLATPHPSPPRGDAPQPQFHRRQRQFEDRHDDSHEGGYVPPSGASNYATRRVGGSWTMALTDALGIADDNEEMLDSGHSWILSARTD